MEFSEHPFWDFSLKVHQQPGVYESCLELQRSYSLDVNLLFYCCWLGWAGAGRLSPGMMRQAMAAVAGWQEEVVRPIWRARWKLKPSFGSFPAEATEPLRQALIQAELDAEHIEQLQLAGALALDFASGLEPLRRAEDAAANLALYSAKFFSPTGAMPPADELGRGTLPQLLAACFPELEQGEAPRLMVRALKARE